MQVFRDSKELKRVLQDGSALTVGTFDGMHMGHRSLVGFLTDQASKRELKSVVVTFEPHPIYVLKPEIKVERIVAPDEKINRLSKFGLDYLLIMDFNNKLANFTAMKFFAEVLISDLKTGFIALGYNHTFGKNKEGNFEFLKGIISDYACDIDAVDPVIFEEKPVSSSRIRKAIKNGQIDKANQMLVEPFTLPGVIVKGKELGHDLGYPTINVKVDAGKLMPQAGVYAAVVDISDNEIPGMMYVHPQPAGCDLEVNLFGFENLVYDERVVVKPLLFTREAIKFSDYEQLKEQLKKDEKEIKSYFKLI